MKASLVQPALIGGLVGGILSALPLISGGNLCCCLWVVSGGAVAAYLLQQNQTAPITPGDGALVGLLAGVAGAFVYLVASIPINLMMGPFQRMMLERVFENMRDMPPQFREYATAPLSGAFQAAIGFIFMLFVGAIFSTLGGLLGAVIFGKKIPPAPPGTIDVTPPA
jgi:hypothetical protein